MSPFKCCLCFQPSNKFPEYFKTVLTEFTQSLNKIQPFRLQHIKVDKLALCKSCWICVMQVHQFNHELCLKKETCDTKKAFLASKIRRAQRSLLDESENIEASCEDFQQLSASESNVEDWQVCVQSKDEGNQPFAENEERNQSLRSPPPLSPPCNTSLKTTADSDSDAESIELYEITDVFTPATDSWSPAANSAEEEPVEATADDTSGSSDPESEPDESAQQPTEAVSDDTTSESDSESESKKSRRVSSRSKKLPKSTKKTSGWRIRSSNIKRLSETDFTYLNKYPFQRTAVGFKCGLCSLISNVYNGSSRIYYNILKHIHQWHIRSTRVRSNKIRQRFIEIAPNRFQYGDYKVELIDGNYRCEECGELKVAKACGKHAPYEGIIRHILRHHENPSREYICDQCGKVYRTLFGLSEHKKTKHQSSVGQYPCTKCSKTFATRGRASVHEIVVHGIKKKFICEICGKECSKKYLLNTHIAFVHNGQKIKCDDCDKTFGSQIALNIHRHCHLGTKFTCDICGMDFSQQCSVKRHKRTAHAR